MVTKTNYTPLRSRDEKAIPFTSAEEAWFWFIQAHKAKQDGARFSYGQGLAPRPCEPLDILKVVDRLYRNRRLLWDHVLVLNHYGKRMMAPDPERVKEMRASTLWDQAFERITEILEKKGIVRKPEWYEGHEMEAAE